MILQAVCWWTHFCEAQAPNGQSWKIPSSSIRTFKAVDTLYLRFFRLTKPQERLETFGNNEKSSVLSLLKMLEGTTLIVPHSSHSLFFAKFKRWWKTRQCKSAAMRIHISADGIINGLYTWVTVVISPLFWWSYGSPHT